MPVLCIASPGTTCTVMPITQVIFFLMILIESVICEYTKAVTRAMCFQDPGVVDSDPGK
jgi:hypothetical protein